MPTEVLMPKLGLTMTEGRVVSWLVEEGQPIVPGEVLFEVENDKAVHEIEATSAGILGRIAVGEDKEVPVGAIIGYILAPGETVDDIPAVHLPAVTAEIASSSGAQQPTHAATATPAGVIRASPSARRLSRELGIDLVEVAATGPGGRVVARDVESAAATRSVPVKASPAARRAARELGIGVGTLLGTGPGGRVMVEDVEAAAHGVTLEPGLVALDRVPFSGVRRLIAERMMASLHDSAQLTLTREVNADSFVETRSQLNAEQSEGDRISFDAMLVYVVSRALKAHPGMNAQLDGEEIIHLATVNIGVAVDTERGLLVPVIRDADTKSVQEVSDSFRGLVGQIERNEILADDLQGSTFTISNLGAFGIDAFTPILNPPEVGVLGVGRIQTLPAIDESTGQVVAQRRMMLSLSFDHRLIDGAPAARFLADVADLIEGAEAA